MAAGLALLPAMARGAAPGADIPIRLAGNLPWTGVWINGQGPFRFRIASGSNTFHVSPVLAEKLGLKLAPGENLMANTRYGRKVVDVYRGDLVIGGQLPLTNMPMIPFPDRDEGPFPGTIPIPADRVTTFEWDAGVMRYSADLPDTAGYAKIPLRHSEVNLGWLPRLDARINGKPVRLALSTGSSHGLTLHSDAVKRLGLWDGPGPFYDRMTKRADREVTLRIARRGDLELGGVRFASPVIGMDDPAKSLMERRDAEDDGEIGMEVLRRADLILDPRRDTAWMRPTSAMAGPWEQDRAGFQVWTEGEGPAKVIRVDPGSPAEAAGLKVGDVVATTPPNVQKLIAAQMMPAGTKIELPVQRDGTKMRIAIVNADRL